MHASMPQPVRTLQCYGALLAAPPPLTRTKYADHCGLEEQQCEAHLARHERPGLHREGGMHVAQELSDDEHSWYNVSVRPRASWLLPPLADLAAALIARRLHVQQLVLPDNEGHLQGRVAREAEGGGPLVREGCRTVQAAAAAAVAAAAVAATTAASSGSGGTMK